MKRRKTKSPKKIRGNHNIDLIDDELYHRTKNKIKKMKFNDK